MLRLCLDFETYYDSAGVSLSVLSTEEYLAHPRFAVNGCAVVSSDRSIRPAFMDPDEFEAFVPTVDWTRVEVASHNAGFDARILARKYGILKVGRWVDTMAMARATIQHRTFRASLDAVSAFFGLPLKTGALHACKGLYADQIKARGLWSAYAAYGLQDAENCLALSFELEPLMPPGEMGIIHWTVQQVVDPVVVVDRSLLSDRLARIEATKAATLARIGLLERDALMSPDRFADMLRAVGIEPATKTGKRGPIYAFARTDPFMQDLLDDEAEEVRDLAMARLGEKSTQEETRVRRFLAVSAVAPRGTLPMPLAYHAAHTGRFGGTDRLNVQNLPRAGEARVLRECLTAPDGCAFVIGDLAQIECRLVAYMAGQENLLRVFREDGDPYCDFGGSVYGRRITKADKPQRQTSKIGVLGLGYGCGPARFSSMLRNSAPRVEDWSLGFSDLIVRTYRQKYSRVPVLWNMLDQAAVGVLAQPKDVRGVSDFDRPVRHMGHCLLFERERVTLPSGRCVNYPGIGDDGQGLGQLSYQRHLNGRARVWGGVVTENVVQAIARDILTEMQRTIMAAGIRVVLQVHDELVMLATVDEAPRVKGFVEEVMGTPPAWAPDFPIGAEVHVSNRYNK